MGPRQRSLIALVLAVSSLLGCGPSSVIERTTGPAPAGPRARSAADETQAEPSVVLRVSVGCQPKQVVFTPDGSHLVVPLLGDTGVDLVRIADGRVTRLSAGEYDEAKGFVEAIVDPHRGRILVSQMTTARVHAFSYDGAHLRSYPTHGSWSKVVELSPDGRLMVVSNWLSDTLTVLRAEDGTLLHTISVPEARTPRGLAFTPAGETLVIAWFGSGEITFHNTREWSLAARLTTGGACRHVVVHPDRPVAYVSDMARRRVLVVSLETNEIAASVRVDSNPNTLRVSPDGKRLFVSCRGPNNPDGYELRSPEPGAIHVIDTDTLETRSVVTGGTQPTGLALSPDGRFVASTNFQDDDVVVWELP